MDEVINQVSLGLSELEAADKLGKIYTQLGGDGNSFDAIIAYGANGANPHHENDNSCLLPGDSVIIDMGCKYKGYCSDMTRTVFYQEVSDEARNSPMFINTNHLWIIKIIYNRLYCIISITMPDNINP